MMQQQNFPTQLAQGITEEMLRNPPNINGGQPQQTPATEPTLIEEPILSPIAITPGA